MANQNHDERDPLTDPGKKIDPGAPSESENAVPPSRTRNFTDPSTSGGATAEDQDSATGQHTA
jgi:hypothetical protein